MRLHYRAVEQWRRRLFACEGTTFWDETGRCESIAPGVRGGGGGGGGIACVARVRAVKCYDSDAAKTLGRNWMRDVVVGATRKDGV
jgi:hypothetical protein